MRGNRAMPGLWRPDVAKGFEDHVSLAGILAYVAVMVLATVGFWCWHRSREEGASTGIAPGGGSE